MTTFAARPVAACLLGLLIAAPTVWAGQIYRWTDSDGVVHFSQTPPPSDQPIETVEIEDSRPSDFDPEADIFGVAEQQARMQAMREDMARRRAEAVERRREAEARRPPPVEPVAPAWPRYRWPVFWPRPPEPELPIIPPQRPPSVIAPPRVEVPQ